MKKILMIGLGSIGQRHLKNIKELDSTIIIYAYRQRKKELVIKELEVIKTHKNIQQYWGIEKEYYDSDEALNANHYDIVYICNPSSFHLETAIKVAEKGFNIFIEKPLSHNLEKLDLFQSIVKEKGILVFIGFQMRFHPCVEWLKKEVVNNSFVSASVNHGSNMLTWHPYEDMKDTYVAHKSLGGGVLLTQIHELDLLLYIFGDVFVLGSCGGNNSNWKMDVEDSVDALLKTIKGLPIQLHLNFIQELKNREIQVLIQTGQIWTVDLIRNKLVLDNQIMNYDMTINWNTLFLRQTRLVLESLKEGKVKEPLAGLEDGVKSLKLAMEIKEGINK